MDGVNDVGGPSDEYKNGQPDDTEAEEEGDGASVQRARAEAKYRFGEGVTEEDFQQAVEDLSTLSLEDREHVTMEVTVDVSEMDEQDTLVLQALANQYESSFQEVVEKNRDYSWSFLTTGRKLADNDSMPVDSPTRSQVFGLLTRIGDKRERLVENVYGNGSATVSDDPATTAQEAANYWQFVAFVLENPELASSF